MNMRYEIYAIENCDICKMFSMEYHNFLNQTINVRKLMNLAKFSRFYAVL